MKLWFLYTKIKQNVYFNAELFLRHCLSQLPKKCGIQMTYTSHPSQKKGFNNKPSITRSSETLMQHIIVACPNGPSHIATINWEKNANDLINWKVLLLFLPMRFRSFQSKPLNPINEYWIISPFYTLLCNMQALQHGISQQLSSRTA